MKTPSNINSVQPCDFRDGLRAVSEILQMIEAAYVYAKFDYKHSTHDPEDDPDEDETIKLHALESVTDDLMMMNINDSPFSGDERDFYADEVSSLLSDISYAILNPKNNRTLAKYRLLSEMSSDKWEM